MAAWLRYTFTILRHFTQKMLYEYYWLQNDEQICWVLIEVIQLNSFGIQNKAKNISLYVHMFVIQENNTWSMMADNLQYLICNLIKKYWFCWRIFREINILSIQSDIGMVSLYSNPISDTVLLYLIHFNQKTETKQSYRLHASFDHKQYSNLQWILSYFENFCMRKLKLATFCMISCVCKLNLE